MKVSIIIIILIILISSCGEPKQKNLITKNIDEECKSISPGQLMEEAKNCRFSKDCEPFCTSRCIEEFEFNLQTYSAKKREGLLYCICSCIGEK